MAVVTTLEWDEDLVAGFADATCTTRGITIESGNPDEHRDFAANLATVELDNTTGEWSRYAANGTQTIHGPGDELALWVLERDTGIASWLFHGTISRWDEHEQGTIVVEAWCDFATLAQPIGTYTPGTNGQKPGPRLSAIKTAAGRAAMVSRFDTGDVTLTAQSTDASPLEEMQAVASSDGGAFFSDADGTLVYMNRNYRFGRSDQSEIPVASDNVCTVPYEVWGAVLSNNDSGLAETVIFENVAHLQAFAPAGQPISGSVFAETDHQWTTQIEGETLAATVYAGNNEARVNVDEFTLYLYDPGQPGMHHAVEWRLLDMLRFIHDAQEVDGTNRLDINTLIVSIAHDITPDQWIMTVATARALAPNAVLVWNPVGDPYSWNATDAVWGY